MCGILATSRRIVGLNHVTEFLQFRGPDLTNHVEINGVDFVHTLLSMTGLPMPQPFTNDDNSVVALFNGEIYNYRDFGDFDSDGCCILPIYEKFGFDCVKHMDGEFALVLIDFEKDILLFSTDIFSIKPLWLAIEGRDFALSSYESSIDRLGFAEPIQVEANSTYILCLSTLELIKRKDVYCFDLTQHKSDFVDWNRAFEKAIAKRTQNIKHGIFIGLSSGYDSGAIACALENQNVDFTAYSVIGSENRDTIEKRIARIDASRLIELPLEEFLHSREYLKNHCEEYALRIDNGEQDILDDFQVKYIEVCDILDELEPIYRELKDPEVTDKVRVNRNEKKWLEQKISQYLEVVEYRNKGQMLTNDNGAIGMGHICSSGRKEGQLIYLSGSGADEIFSDYGFGGVKHFGHSTIGGKFPESLERVFPWKNFFDNTQRAYLMKEEYVSGSHGIEGRYPFLDKMVVQEFLWLTPELKNSTYKSVLHQYMEESGYPFDKQQKVGFNCGFSLDGKGNYSNNVSTHRIVGEALRESLIVNLEREIGKTRQRKNRFRILNHLSKD